jgi:hypothetical protein
MTANANKKRRARVARQTSSVTVTQSPCAAAARRSTAWLPLRTDIERVTRAGRTAHGYTLTIWAAGMSCTSHHGLPNLIAVLLFTVGATVSFGLVQLIAGRPDRGCSGNKDGTTHDWRASVQAAPVAVAAAASWLIAAVPRPWCWLLVSSVATVAFLLLHSTQDAVWRRWNSHMAALEGQINTSRPRRVWTPPSN